MSAGRQPTETPVYRVLWEATTKIHRFPRKDTIMENNTNTELTAVEAAPVKVYCSIKDTDLRSKAIIYNALNAPTVKIADHIGQTIDIKDVYMGESSSVDEETGELRNLKKTILIDPDGNTYFSVSNGIYRAVENLIGIFGNPTYNTPIRVKVIEVKLKKGSTYALQIVD